MLSRNLQYHSQLRKLVLWIDRGGQQRGNRYRRRLLERSIRVESELVLGPTINHTFSHGRESSPFRESLDRSGRSNQRSQYKAYDRSMLHWYTHRWRSTDQLRHRETEKDLRPWASDRVDEHSIMSSGTIVQYVLLIGGTGGPPCHSYTPSWRV